MDRGNYRVVHLSPTGHLLGSFGQLGTGHQDIYYGWGIALDQDGNIYICNHVIREDGFGMAHDGIKVFTPDGHFVREIGGQDYDPSDQITPRNAPYGLDIDRQGRIYVADYGTDTVRVFDLQGNLITRLLGEQGSKDGQVNGLNDVAVDDERGLLYVVEGNNSRIQQFSLSTTAVGGVTITHRLSIGSYGRAPGQFAYPQFLAVDKASGRVYVADMANRRIQVFDTQGRYIVEFSPPGIKTWQVMGLEIGRDGAIYAADALNGAIWVFEPEGQLRRRIEVQP